MVLTRKEFQMSQLVSSRSSHPVVSAFGGFAAGLCSVIVFLSTHASYGRIAAALVAGVLVAVLSAPLSRATRSERTGAVAGFVSAVVLLGALIAALAHALSTMQFG
jgi:hypothetical protein